MAVEANTLIVPGHGTVFTAAPNTALPAAPLTAFGLSTDSVGTGPAEWKNLGHTSKQNTVSFSKEGGEKTTLDTWLADAVRSTTSAESWSIGINALQISKDVLDLAFAGALSGGKYSLVSGNVTKKALVVLCQDANNDKLGFYLPSVDVSLGDVPTIDTENFLEIPLTGAILSVPNAVIPTVNGKQAWGQIFGTNIPTT